jgi:purine-binding chemotaxis protein CheW
MQIASTALPAIPVLLCGSGGRLCALPLSQVGETLRPLPIMPLPGMPACVLGVSTLRGEAVPVIALSALLGAVPAPPGRFVSLRLDGRSAALAVDEVLGVHALPAALLDQTPPLLDGGADAQVASIGIRDAEVMLVLRAARIVPEAVWAALAEPVEA